jgi:hypothetical protein
MTEKQAKALPVGALLRNGKNFYLVISRNTRGVTFAVFDFPQRPLAARRALLFGAGVRVLKDFHRIA